VLIILLTLIILGVSVRILHTSDLHLGKRLHQHSLLPDQEHVLAQIVEYIVEYDPDLFVVAGDVFDRSLPPEDAMVLFGHWLNSIRKERPVLPVVIIAGNHDSGERIAWPSKLLNQDQIFLRGIPRTVEEAIHFQTRQGELVEVWALPFAWAGDLPSPEGQTATQVGAFETAIDIIQTRQDKERKQILVAHCFAQGGKESESERQLLGQATLVDSQLFKTFDYVALGHLHKPQKVCSNTWYSGSPLAYSFSENSDEKCVLLVDCNDGEPVVTQLQLKPLRSMRIVETTLDELLESNVYDHLKEMYLSVRLTQQCVISDPVKHISARFPHLLNLRVPIEDMPELSLDSESRMGKTDLAEDLHSFWLHVTGEIPSDEVLAVFNELRPDQGVLR
jgi:DNA repair protein SbcD/Mre11